MIEHPLLRAPRPGSVFARSTGRPIATESYLGDVAALAARLPRSGHVVNLCRDRYRFAVGFAAALCRQQVTLLPPNDTAAMLDRLATDYADVYCLADAVVPDGPLVFHYPSNLTHNPAGHTV